MNSRTRIVAAVAATGAIAALVSAAGGSAGASVVSGALAGKSVGTKYAGAEVTTSGNDTPSTTVLTRTVTPGGTGTWDFQVVNNGTVATSYRLHIFVVPFDPPASEALKAGTTDITSAALTTAGWPTPSLAPGKKLGLILKATAPDNAGPDYSATFGVELLSADGSTTYAFSFNSLSIVDAKTDPTHDVFVKVSDQKLTAADQGEVENFLSTPTVGTGASTSWTITVRNNTHATIQRGIEIRPFAYCNNFQSTAKIGTTDISAQIFNQTEGQGYTLAPIAPGASVVIKVKTTNTGPWPSGCFTGNYVLNQILFYDPTPASFNVTAAMNVYTNSV
jgi:hypothetical protein